MDDIWDEWGQHYANGGMKSYVHRICKDGIVNEQRYAKSQPRILYVMKEVNEWEGDSIKCTGSVILS